MGLGRGALETDVSIRANQYQPAVGGSVAIRERLGPGHGFDCEQRREAARSRSMAGE